MSRILSIGAAFPEFNVDACVSLEKGQEFAKVSNKDIKGQWAVFFFWPMDFTFVCPTEIAEFNKAFGDFKDRDAQLFGASTDTSFVHLAWRQNHPDLKAHKFPMLADNKKQLSEALGILHAEDKVPL